MELLKVITDLVKFRTETGNKAEIKDCLQYVKGLFSKTSAQIEIYEKGDLSPVILLANTKDKNFDVLVVGHLDVVPAEDNMFSPYIKDGKMYGRGTLDMKSFAAVGLNSLEYVLDKRLPLKFGVLLSTDEEKGSAGLESYLEDVPEINSKVVLDVDVAGDITKIVAKCKNPVFTKLIAEGKEAHGSTPWEGVDANEKLLMVLHNIRKFYPYYSRELPKPHNTWIDTVHFAKISGGDIANVISNYAEALLDFRLTEKSLVADLEENLKKCLIDGVTYKIVSSSTPVVMDENNPIILQYKELAELILGKDIEFEYIGGATDSREFAKKGSVVIMHSGSGHGMHAKEEYVEIESVERLADIQIKFLNSFMV